MLDTRYPRKMETTRVLSVIVPNKNRRVPSLHLSSAARNPVAFLDTASVIAISTTLMPVSRQHSLGERQGNTGVISVNSQDSLFVVSNQTRILAAEFHQILPVLSVICHRLMTRTWICTVSVESFYC